MDNRVIYAYLCTLEDVTCMDFCERFMPNLKRHLHEEAEAHGTVYLEIRCKQIWTNDRIGVNRAFTSAELELGLIPIDQALREMFNAKDPGRPGYFISALPLVSVELLWYEGGNDDGMHTYTKVLYRRPKHV